MKKVSLERKPRPWSLMMTAGYNPKWSEGSAKPPIFPTSTYVFESSEEGKKAFEVAYGLREPEENEKNNLIYGRINHPGLQIAEERLAICESGAEACVIFSSGLAAITTAHVEFSEIGDFVLCGSPLYGGTDHFIKKVFPKRLGVTPIFFNTSHSKKDIMNLVETAGATGKVSMMLIETPANPNNFLYDIREMKNICKSLSTSEKKVLLAVDNTYMGPYWQSPMLHGADLVLYSLTKFIGGHSDIIAGACLGSAELIQRIKVARTFWGDMSDPFSTWLLLRSLETLKIRMDQHAKNAKMVAKYLGNHPLIENVRYVGNLTAKDGKQYLIKRKQCKTGGAMITFDIEGDEARAFKFMDNLKLIKKAVSLGSTGSLIEPPYSQTHADVDADFKMKLGIKPNTVRLSVGIEDWHDIIDDIEQAMKA